MSARAPTIDVSGLPTTTFGLRNVTGWATVAFMVIEGTTLAIAVFVYFYLRKNFTEWPPAPTPPPSLGVPLVSLCVLLAAIVPMWAAGRAAKKLDLAGVRRFMLAGAAISAVAVVCDSSSFSRSIRTGTRTPMARSCGCSSRCTIPCSSSTQSSLW